MEYKLNILGALHWYAHQHNVLTLWTLLRVKVVANYFLGIELSDDDADWITEQLNQHYLNTLKEATNAVCR